jgi:hypothetical protein
MIFQAVIQWRGWSGREKVEKHCDNEPRLKGRMYSPHDCTLPSALFTPSSSLPTAQRSPTSIHLLLLLGLGLRFPTRRSQSQQVDRRVHRKQRKQRIHLQPAIEFTCDGHHCINRCSAGTHRKVALRNGHLTLDKPVVEQGLV